MDPINPSAPTQPEQQPAVNNQPRQTNIPPAQPQPIQQQPQPQPQPYNPAISPMLPPTPSQNPYLDQNKKKTGLVAGIIAGVVLFILIIGGILGWLFVFSPAAQAQKASTKFMNAATAGDLDKLEEINDSKGDEAQKAFLTSITESVKGDYKLKEKAMKDSKGYFLYDLTGAESKQARTIVEKKDGKWIVADFVYGEDNLALIPSAKSGDTSNPVEEATDLPASTQSSSACVVDSDVAVLTGGEAYGTDFTIDGYRKYVVDTYFFKADSTDYNYPDMMPEYLDKIKAFNDANKNKEFTIHFKGKVFEGSTTKSGLTLSNQRAEKIKAELVSRGVPASKVVVDEPQKSSDTYNDGSERNVDLSIQVKIPCTAQ